VHVLVTGDRNAGKTTLVRRVVSALHDRGLTTAGFYEAGGPETLELVAAGTGERRVFATQSAAFDGPEVGRYTVDPGTVEWGLQLGTRPADVLVVDEIGRLEARGEGFAPLLADLQPTRYGGVLVSVRREAAELVADAFPPEAAVERVEVTATNRESLPERVVELLVER
jgi:nucleoside-triphosphatase THEP1